jgi:hypothetical protein
MRRKSMVPFGADPRTLRFLQSPTNSTAGAAHPNGLSDVDLESRQFATSNP